MKKEGRKITKRITALIMVLFLLSINSFAAVVSDNDGSAFITKAEFDSLKNSFQSQIDSYNQSIDTKIDGAIASYLAGLRVVTKPVCEFDLCEEDRKAILKSQLDSDYWTEVYKGTTNVWNGFLNQVVASNYSNTPSWKDFDVRHVQHPDKWTIYHSKPYGTTGNFHAASYINISTWFDFYAHYNTNRDGWSSISTNASSILEGLTSGISMDTNAAPLQIVVDAPVRSYWNAITTTGKWDPTDTKTVVPFTCWTTEPLENKFPMTITYEYRNGDTSKKETFTLDKMTDKFKAHAYEYKYDEITSGVQSYDGTGTQFKNIPEYLWYRPFAYRDTINWKDGYIKFSAKLSSWKGKDYNFTSYVNIADFGEIPVPDPSASNFTKVYYAKAAVPSGWFTLYDSFTDRRRSEGSIGFAIDNRRSGTFTAPVDVWQDLYLLQSFDLKVDLFSKDDPTTPVKTIEFWHDCQFYPNGYTGP